MATETGSAVTTTPADVGLKREMGFIGAVWASESSIIGSGWLFGALYAAQAAGPAAIIAWVIGGVAVVVLALIHAELGAMYPVSGGTARFPHFAFGSRRGHVVRLLLLAAGRHRRADRVLRGHELRLALVAQHLQPNTGNVTGAGFVHDHRPDGRSSPG